MHINLEEGAIQNSVVGLGEETGTASCDYYHVQPNTLYTEEKSDLERSLQYISRYDEFCT